jgi:hypothetical protein
MENMRNMQHIRHIVSQNIKNIFINEMGAAETNPLMFGYAISLVDHIILRWIPRRMCS